MKQLGRGIFALYHGALLAVCAMNLMANNFVLKQSRFYDDQLVSSDLFARWILLAPLFLPLWIRWARSLGIFQFRFNLAAGGFVVASILLNYPFYLAGSGSSDWIDIARAAVRDGVTQPYAAVFFVGSVLSMAGQQTQPAAANVEKSALRFLAGIVCAGLVLKIFLAGLARPRLEDEVAYHIQSLIFESGALRAKFTVPAGMMLDHLQNAAFVPFLIQSGPEYYSAHMHGWSAILAAFALLHVKPLAPFLLTIVNLGLFYTLCRHYLPEEKSASSRIVAFALFAASPILLFLSNTFMSHTLALALSQAVVLSHARLSAGKSFAAVGLIVLVVCGFFVRPQSMVPVVAALVIYEILKFLAGDRSGVVLRLSLLIASCAASYGALRGYASLLGSASVIPMTDYVRLYLVDGCQSLGFGPGHGCFPTYGTMGHSFAKTLLNLGDLFARCNQELSPGALPLVLILVALAFRNVRKLQMAGPEMLFLLILLGTIAEFGLYFHNGGESYRGRYLAEAAFALFLLLGLLIRHEDLPVGMVARTAVTASAIMVPVIVCLQIRGEYFHPTLPSFASVRAFSLSASGAVVSSVSIQTEAETTRDAFTGRDIEISPERRKRYLNLGYGTLAGTAVRINQSGFLEDADGNLLFTDLSDEDISALSHAAFRLRYSPFEPVTKTSRVMRFWTRKPPQLEPWKASGHSYAKPAESTAAAGLHLTVCCDSGTSGGRDAL